jgi:NADH-quinone oxidoreductase subunit C
MNLQETIQTVRTILVDTFGESVVIAEDVLSLQPSLTVPAERIADICRTLYEHEQTYFDYLSCLTAIDNGPELGTMEIVYNLYSIPYNLSCTLKISFARTGEGEALPQVPSVSRIWRTADWHEREAYDLLGIIFTGHPDLRRILLTADWEGHPLRKDYRQQETYHGIKVAY